MAKKSVLQGVHFLVSDSLAGDSIEEKWKKIANSGVGLALKIVKSTVPKKAVQRLRLVDSEAQSSHIEVEGIDSEVNLSFAALFSMSVLEKGTKILKELETFSDDETLSLTQKDVNSIMDADQLFEHISKSIEAGSVTTNDIFPIKAIKGLMTIESPDGNKKDGLLFELETISAIPKAKAGDYVSSLNVTAVRTLDNQNAPLEKVKRVEKANAANKSQLENQEKIVNMLNDNKVVNAIVEIREKGNNFFVRLVSEDKTPQYVGFIDATDSKIVGLAQNARFKPSVKGVFTLDDTGSLQLIIPKDELRGTDIPDGLNEEFNRIISEQIDTPDNLMKKFKFMQKHKFPSELMLNIFKSYESIEGIVEKYFFVDPKLSEKAKSVAKENTIISLKAHIQPQPKTEFIIPDDFYRMEGSPKSSSIDLIFLTAAQIAKGRNTLLRGPKGGGKDLLISWQAWLFQRPYWNKAMNANLTEMDLLAAPTFADGVQYTEPKDLVYAMQYGGLINLSEINSSNPSILTILHSVLDDNRLIEVEGYGLVKAHENFVTTATMNENYAGTSEMNEATADRFSPIDIPSTTNIKEVLQKRVPNASKEAIELCSNVYKEMKTQWKNNDSVIDERADSTRAFVNALELSVLGLPIAQMLIKELTGRIPQNDFESVSAIQATVSRFVK